MRRLSLACAVVLMLVFAAACGGGGGIVPNPNPGGNNPGGNNPGGNNGFDGTFVTPPAETYVDRAPAGATPTERWLANSYEPLPAPFDTDRVFQNDSLRTWADEILRLTNLQRTTNGLPALTMDAHLEMVEQAHCRDMALRDFFDHVNPDGLDPFQRLQAVNPPVFTSAGENIAAGQNSPQELIDSWMNSPGHRANILNASYERVGIGVFYDSGPGQFHFYYGQLFATFQGNPDTHDWLEISEVP
jgi:uncharacterized protein YkwD